MVIKIIQIQLHLVQQTGNSNNLFFSMITMQVLYSMFISVLLFDKYSKDRATGARISLSPSSNLLLKVKTFITCLLVVNISIGLMVTYLLTQTKFLSSINITQVFYLEILAVISILKYLSPGLLVNRLATYKFDIESLLILITTPVILFLICIKIGGKKWG